MHAACLVHLTLLDCIIITGCNSVRCGPAVSSCPQEEYGFPGGYKVISLVLPPVILTFPRIYFYSIFYLFLFDMCGPLLLARTAVKGER
jgi:hypothetical protein